MWLLYNLLLTISAPLWVPWMLWRAYRRGEKPNWRERQGDYRESVPKRGERPRLWVHAVSVGEVVAATPLLRALRSALPDHEIVLSVTTSSGHQTAREAGPGLFDYLVYLPIDIPRFTLSAMQRVRPDALIVMETELWMNLFWAAKTFDAKTFVVNARLSDRSYPRALRFGAFYRAFFRNVDGVSAQSDTDAERFRTLGAMNVEAAGNLKFDQALEGLDDATDWRKELGLDDRPVVVVGSLRSEEFATFAAAILAKADCQWVVAPRHLDRVPEFVEALRSVDRGGADLEIGESPSLGYRSRGTHGRVTILDTYGELARVYRIADVVVVGGSFQRLGGQNVIQPLAWGKPVVHGPYMANFRDVATLAERAGATLVCEGSVERCVDELLSDPDRREHMGAAARRLVKENRGAAAKMAHTVARMIGSNLKP